MQITKRELMYKIMLLNMLHRYSISQAASRVGIYRGQPPVLDYLSAHDGCSQREIAEYLHVSPASVAVSIKRMQKAGLLIKDADDKDLRYNHIYITEKGKTLRDECLSEFESVDDRLFSGFSEDELSVLAGFLDRLNDNLNDKELDFFEIKAKLKKENKEGKL